MKFLGKKLFDDRIRQWHAEKRERETLFPFLYDYETDKNTCSDRPSLKASERRHRVKETQTLPTGLNNSFTRRRWRGESCSVIPARKP
jgi:hypothetical protein